MFLVALPLLLLTQAEPDSPPTHFRGALELSALSFPSGPPGGPQDLFANVTPLIHVESGDDFAFELGAELKIRLIDPPPEQRPYDYGHFLRRQDWQEASDFGQILRDLQVGSDSGAFQLRGGPLRDLTLGWGHIIDRYSNQLNPNYHPGGLELVGYLGPTRSELVASDFLGARLFAGEVALDLGRTFANAPDRFHLALSAAYDAAEAGGVTPSLAIGHLDADAALYRGERLQVFAEGGAGGRMGIAQTSIGGVFGVSVDAQLPAAALGGKLELRKNDAGFRQGMFGAAYELSRFSGVGTASLPEAAELIPDAFSGQLEFHVGFGPSLAVTPVLLSGAIEHFTWGRTDADLAATVALWEGRVAGSVRGIVVGWGVAPRYSAQAELRWRFFRSLYALGYGGTVYQPQPDSTLLAGGYVGVGLAADFER